MAAYGPNRALTAKQRAFVREFPKDNNATQAALRAGYSRRYAHTIGPQLLGKNLIRQALAERASKITAYADMTANDVLMELAILARSDIRHYVMGVDGHVALAPGAPDAAMRAVASAKMKRRTIPVLDGPPIVEHDLEIRLWNKNEALRDLGKYWRLFVDRLEVTEPMVEEAKRLAEAYGISLDELLAEAQSILANPGRTPMRLIVGGS